MSRHDTGFAQPSGIRERERAIMRGERFGGSEIAACAWT
jgi:hypothetical protein